MESVTNSKRVHKNFVKYGYDKESAILPSKRKNKKYMVLDTYGCYGRFRAYSGVRKKK
jgi:hypothetical protein